MNENKKWFISNKKADFETLGKKYGISPILARCIINRGVAPEDFKKFLYGKRSDMYSPSLLLNADKAAEFLKNAIKSKKKIRIIGDYDVDGEMSTSILLTGIRRCGGNVDYAIPDRIIDGYGINENLIKNASQDGVQVIITCDNGIAAKNQVDLANELGIDVCITDHHEVPFILNEKGDKEYILPNASVIVDPKQEDDTYPQKGICGAVVAYKVIEILYSLYRIPKKELDELLPFAAMATVCDVMELKDENRIIVREGLRLINSNPCLGLKALITACGLDGKTITAGHIGFVLGPTCNAAGRLESASLAVELIFETDEDKATIKAQELRQINDARKSMTESKTEEAIELIENSDMKNDKVLVVKLDDCHESIAGIIAGRLREKYCKPTMVFTDAEVGIKGSGRSIEVYNMFEELNKFRDMFVKFGGHPMAAGMTVADMDTLNALRKCLNDATTLTEDDFCEITHIDIELPLERINLELASEVKLLEPFGVGNPQPLFVVRDLQITRALEMGQKHNAIRYYVKTKYNHRDVLMDFGNIDIFIDHLKEKYGENIMEELKTSSRTDVIETITYQMSVNSYQGKDTAQITLDNFK